MTPARVAPLVLQITPRAPGGVRDFAACLQAEWARSGTASGLIELDRAAARTEPLEQRLRALLARPSQPCMVLLHFSGYGYQRRGLCLWLLHELRAARRGLGAGLRVVTLFHELFAAVPPWRSAFWLSPVQAAIARRLARLSHAVCTNSQHHAGWLRGCIGDTVPLHVRPVFSTIGEPAAVRAVAMRERSLVVFGSQSTRQRAFERLAPHQAELRALGVERIVEAGSGQASAFLPAQTEHVYAGHLGQPQLGALLQQHRFGLIDYPSMHLGKSTVFAAYAVHGCVVLNTAAPGVDADGLRHGRHYLTLGVGATRALAPDASQAIATAARAWYAGHPLGGQAAEFLALLGAGTARAMATGAADG